MILLSCCTFPVLSTGFGWLVKPASDLDELEMAAQKKTMPTNSQTQK